MNNQSDYRQFVRSGGLSVSHHALTTLMKTLLKKMKRKNVGHVLCPVDPDAPEVITHLNG